MEVVDVMPVNILSGLFFGTLLTALCLGVLTIQTSSYYHAFPNDRRPLKLTVGFLWWASHTLVFEAYSSHSIVKDFGSFSIVGPSFSVLFNCFHEICAGLLSADTIHLGQATWEFFMYQGTTACVSVTVQTFFVYRVYSLSGNVYVGALVDSPLASTYLHMSRWSATYCLLIKSLFWRAAATTIKAIVILEFREIAKECTWLIEAWLIIQAISDVVIAASMCILLRRRRTGVQKTDSVINRLALYAISTGLITSVLSCFLVGLISKVGFHDGVIVIGMPLGAVYSITMLANLHMRTRLRARLNTSSPLELIGYSIKKRMRQNAGDRRNEEMLHAPSLNIPTEVVLDTKPMNSDIKVRVAGVPSPVLGGDLNPSPTIQCSPDE
ncbi:hypothetical protein BS47DRAFT_1395391 [Hydnum rufescens UP504]|uniref:DUF6534 domain-containing protein n=1 Tax=Hydnum rufescens UP504 TaxID=1448309 RepID=A0A9P6ASE3_9AGAM|nr:hypothetical protein BS47DRAFT_1395391 [Hydnum rufescens UP504]